MNPEKVIRIGSVTVSIFVREIESDNSKRQLRNVVLQRRYRDGDGEWKTSTSFGLGELPQALTALDLALKYVADAEAVAG